MLSLLSHVVLLAQVTCDSQGLPAGCIPPPASTPTPLPDAAATIFAVDPVVFYSLVFHVFEFAVIHGVLIIITQVIYRI